MGKKYVMKAETAGKIPIRGGQIGQAPIAMNKSFTLTVTAGANGQVHINQGGSGFNPFEIIGFLDVMKTNIVNGIK